MDFIKKLKWFLIITLATLIIGWLFIEYTDRDFLRYGVFKINEYPASVHILYNKSYGLNDQQYEYYISIAPNDFNSLLKGRKYVKSKVDQQYFTATAAANQKFGSFTAAFCYTSGDTKNGLVNIFTNSDNSLVYIIYDID